MELQTFISNALLSIVDGVNDANKKNDCFELSGSFHSGKGVDGTKVDFDLSVVVEESNEDGIGKEGKLGINIFSAGVNSQQKEVQKNSATQRIQFTVFINNEKAN